MRHCYSNLWITTKDGARARAETVACATISITNRARTDQMDTTELERREAGVLELLEGIVRASANPGTHAEFLRRNIMTARAEDRRRERLNRLYNRMDMSRS